MTIRPLVAPDFEGDVAHWWRDNGDGTSTILSQQDVGPALEMNRAMARENDGWSASRELRRAAHIPAVVRLKWLLEEGWDWMDYSVDPGVARKLAEKLNSADWAHLRTAPGRLAVSNGVLR